MKPASCWVTAEFPQILTKADVRRAESEARMSPQPGLCAVRDHHRSPAPEYPGEPGGGVSGDHHSATRAGSQRIARDRRAVTRPYPSKVPLDGASAISTPPTNLRKKVEIVSGCRDGRALRASLRRRARDRRPGNAQRRSSRILGWAALHAHILWVRKCRPRVFSR